MSRQRIHDLNCKNSMRSCVAWLPVRSRESEKRSGAMLFDGFQHVVANRSINACQATSRPCQSTLLLLGYFLHAPRAQTRFLCLCFLALINLLGLTRKFLKPDGPCAPVHSALASQETLTKKSQISLSSAEETACEEF